MVRAFRRGGASRASRCLMCSSIALMVTACSALGLCGEPKVDPETGLPEAPIWPGDTVKVTTGPAPVKAGDKTLTTVEAGTELKAIAVQGAWVKVTVEKDGLKNTGWINKRHLKFVTGASPEKAPEGQAPKSPEPPRKSPAKQLGIWEGFRGIAWATDLKDIEGMELVERGRPLMLHKRASDKLAIGDARLNEIVYGFYKDRFSCVLINCAGLGDFLALQRAVFATYGEGQKPNKFMDRWRWGGLFPPGVKDVDMTLEYNQFAQKGTLFLDYRPLLEERKREEEEAAKKARKDF